MLFLGRAAVDKTVQGGGFGGVLMHHAFDKACAVSDTAGCHAIVLDVVSDGGEAAFARRKAWYESFGFASNSARMFMTLRQVRASVRQTANA